jgi:N-acetylmuramoyl-L-alanine amidase
LPFILEQHLKPAQLVMKIFGGTANTDWVSPSVPSGTETELVDSVTWKQIADNTYELTAHLKNDRQWGFYADYENSDLHLHVKRAPKIRPTADGRLDGLVICLDPGHGGSELGAIGCGGKREAEINLGIALKLESLLKQRGAQVIMTRTDDRLVPLDDRVIMAEKNHVDILLSIHNNSLPDGRDPWNEHGTSSYWYHPQAIELARTLKASEMQAIHFVDLATRWQNLALTRPSAMLSVLYEVGFMINPDEYAFLEDEAGQGKCAEGLANGLYTYLKPHQTAAPPESK